MSDWDLLLTDVHIATMRSGAGPYGVINNAALAIKDGAIAWLGETPATIPDSVEKTISLSGRWLTPALIDCHTHLVFGGNRAAEFEQRLQGVSYEDIARAGGGIMSTVNATRAADPDSLASQSLERLLTLRREGVATVEIKSGYGLDPDSEARMLRVATSLGEHCGLTVRRTFLGAHAIPAEYKGRSDDYVNMVCEDMLPAIAEESLADAVDAYCESIAFSTEQVARVFERAAAFGLPVKLHADQLSDGGGAALAAAFNALSADHLEYTSEAGVRALAESGSVAVLLPGAYITLRETQPPPVAALRDHGVPIAIASDCNPGTSPICSLRASMNLASSQFRLTPEECLAGVTREAARALGLQDDRGTLEVGKRADIAVWDFAHPRELSYWMGLHKPSQLLVNGSPVSID
jgi:imidazolonepropionase